MDVPNHLARLQSKDRSAKFGPVDQSLYRSRAREAGASRACDGPTGAAPIPFSLIRCRVAAAIPRAHHRRRPAAASQGVRFDNTRFAEQAD